MPSTRASGTYPARARSTAAFEGRQIVGHSAPDGFQVDSFIRVAELISNVADIPPGLIRTAPLRLAPEPHGGFADDL